MGSRRLLCGDLERSAASTPWERSADNSWWEPRTKTYPASDCLMPGDVLLFAALEPDPIGRLIERQQLLWGEEPEHARFTHAALYIGLDHLICEAVPLGGVRYSTLDSRLDHFCCLVRRWPGLKPTQSERIALEAAGCLGWKYDWKGLWKAFRTHGPLLDGPGADRLVCSRLCDRAITRALLSERFGCDDPVFHSKSPFPTPATLSRTPKLVDVETGWRLVGSGGGGPSWRAGGDRPNQS
jgi:hypothetical protein